MRVRHHLLKPENGFAVTEAISMRSSRASICCLFAPQQPTGLTVEPSLREGYRCLQGQRTLLIVDECFNGFLDAPKNTAERRS
jgi:aspartate/methionine/tyrosine aminotransferase